MKFKKGFEKTAGLIGTIGKKALGALGGPLGAGLTAMGAVSDFKDTASKMQKARTGLL